MNDNHRRGVGFGNRKIIQPKAYAFKNVLFGIYVDQHPVVEEKLARFEGIERIAEFAGRDGGQKPQPAHVDADDGNLALPHVCDRFEQGAVAAETDNKIGFKQILLIAEGTLGEGVRHVGLREHLLVGRRYLNVVLTLDDFVEKTLDGVAGRIGKRSPVNGKVHA